MKLNSSVQSVVRNVTLILLGMLVTMLGQPTMIPVATAQITHDDTHPVGSTSQVPATSTWISCTPDAVVAYTSRVHVHCTAAVGGISYFAVSTADPANAARILSILSTAEVAGRTLSILYDPADTSGAAIGCQTGDCRLIQAVGF